MNRVEEKAQPLIRASHVSFQFPTATRPALTDINLTIHSGDRVLVIGHNGSGKSTLLSLLGGRRKPQTKQKQQQQQCMWKDNGVSAESPDVVKEAAEQDGIRVMGADPFDDTAMSKHITLIGAPWPAEAYFGNTVDRIASPAPLPARKLALAAALHLELSRGVDKMSAGEKRRVQILHGMLSPATVILLDECSTDIDIAERKTVLALVKKECEERGGCCLYATHILDRIQDWATHLLLMKDGRIVRYLSVDDLHTNAKVRGEVASTSSSNLSLEQFALRFMVSGLADLHDTTEEKSQETGEGGRTFSLPSFPESFEVQGFHDRVSVSANGVLTPEDNSPHNCTEVVIDCNKLTFRDVFKDASFKVFRGERVLLCGCNGAGKSTLLNMLGGKQFFANADGALKVLGKACYDDMTLNAQVAYAGDWWTTVPGGEVHVHEMLSIDTPRAERLRALLAVNLDWDVRHISSGEQKRVQILLYLLADKPVVLLDEATADLDVDQRHALLSFLFAESACRGVTVVYSTHIFGGLEGWADTVVLLDRGIRGVHAVWRKRDGESVDLDRVTEELILLKERETL